MFDIWLNEWCFILLILWTLPWKGVALWKAARSAQKNWFIAILIINTLGILEILYIFVFSKKKIGVSKASKKEAQTKEIQ